MVRSHAQATAAVARAAEHGADLVEFRLDYVLAKEDWPGALITESPLPCIATCRPAWEGGFYEGDEGERLALLLELPAAYLDIELRAFLDSPRLREDLARAQQAVILSTHDFETRPADLWQRVEAMINAASCRVMKLAWRARSLRDNLEAFELTGQKHKPTVAVCMGEMGLASRILAPKFGGLICFAAIDEEAATAPGQPTLEQCVNLYRLKSIGPRTRVFGVVGHPVAHSMSPAIHNAGFAERGVDAVYLPMPIAPGYEPFKATVGSWLAVENLHFSGASVTIPHKENLLRFVRESGGEIEPLAESIGAANTLTIREDGSLYAFNTDYDAALDAVCAGMGIERDELSGVRVAVIGAGGAARAIVAGFASCGATVVVYNRTVEKAEQLAQRFNGRTGKVVAAPLESLCKSCCNVTINCTPIGMHPETDRSPLDTDPPFEGWGPGSVVFDTIYNPIETKLLRDARAAGSVTVSGLDMFVRQAGGQFESWTRRPAPLATFHRVATGRLRRPMTDEN